MEHGTATKQHPDVHSFNRKYNRFGYKAQADSKIWTIYDPSPWKGRWVFVTWGKDYRNPTHQNAGLITENMIYDGLVRLAGDMAKARYRGRTDEK